MCHCLFLFTSSQTLLSAISLTLTLSLSLSVNLPSPVSLSFSLSFFTVSSPFHLFVVCVGVCLFNSCTTYHIVWSVSNKCLSCCVLVYCSVFNPKWITTSSFNKVTVWPTDPAVCPRAACACPHGHVHARTCPLDFTHWCMCMHAYPSC